MEAPSHCLEQGALSATDEPVYDRPSFGYLDTDFEEMDQLYTSLGIIHLFALSGMQVGFFINGIRKALLRLGILQETVDIWMVPISFGLCWLDRFSVSVVRSLLQRSSLKGDPRDGEYGDDLDALNGCSCPSFS